MTTFADVLFRQLVSFTDTVFYLPGGGASFLVDALARSVNLRRICALHEQGAGYAALGYAQASGKLGVCLVTSGPGASNALTPCLGAWTDSVPVLFISGQVRTEYLAKRGLRSRGIQEGPTASLAYPITKFAGCPKSVEEATIALDVAVALALKPRQGPTWLDLCQDIQGATCE